jgi:hypothetical protein
LRGDAGQLVIKSIEDVLVDYCSFRSGRVWEVVLDLLFELVIAYAMSPAWTRNS